MLITPPTHQSKNILSDLITNKRFIVTWSVFYVVYLCFRFMSEFSEKAFAESNVFVDVFINYSGGFVRRGLLGQVFLWCYQVGISPIWAAVSLSLSAFLVIAAYMIAQFRKHGYSLCLLTVGWFLGDIGLLGLAAMRRDYIIMCFFLLVVWLWKRMGIGRWVLLTNILVCLFILCYEPFALFAIPFCVLLTRLRLKNWVKSVICWLLPALTFLICCKYAGGKEVYDAIVVSTADFLPSPGIMGFLKWGTIEPMKYHFAVNFLQFHHGIPVVLISFVSLSSILFYSVNAIPVFTQDKLDFTNRRYTLAFLMSAFLFLSPMFTFLSIDYGRTCVYICLSSYILFFQLDEKERGHLLPQFVYSWADRLIAFSDKHLRPTRFKIVFIMLFLGISAFTGGGIEEFIKGSEFGNMANYFLTTIGTIPQ